MRPRPKWASTASRCAGAIRSARSDLPYKTASGVTYDSGDFAALTKQALELADGKGFAQRKRESRKRGKLRGLGIGNFLEVTAPPSKELADIAFNADGTVTLTTGTLDFGMGHATPFAQVLERAARHSVRENLAVAGRQRPARRGRRLRRFEIDHAQRHRDRRSRRQGHREGQGTRRTRARSRRRPTSSSTTAASSSSAPTARSRSWSLREKLRNGVEAAG